MTVEEGRVAFDEWWQSCALPVLSKLPGAITREQALSIMLPVARAAWTAALAADAGTSIKSMRQAAIFNGTIKP